MDREEVAKLYDEAAASLVHAGTEANQLVPECTTANEQAILAFRASESFANAAVLRAKAAEIRMTHPPADVARVLQLKDGDTLVVNGVLTRESLHALKHYCEKTIGGAVLLLETIDKRDEVE